MNGGTMFETKSSTRPSVFDRPSTMRTSLTSSFDIGKSAWGNDRSIWHNNGAAARASDTEIAKPSALRQNSSSAIKFGKPSTNAPLSPLDNPRNPNPQSNLGWISAINRSTDIYSRPNLTSPTKQSQNSWLFNGRLDLDIENTSLLAGSAPENEYFDAKDPRNSNPTSARSLYSERSSSMVDYENSISSSTINHQHFSLNSAQPTLLGTSVNSTKGSSSTRTLEYSSKTQDRANSISVNRSPTSRDFGGDQSSRHGLGPISPTQSRFKPPTFDASFDAAVSGPRTPNEDVDYAFPAPMLDHKPRSMTKHQHLPSFHHEQPSVMSGHSLPSQKQPPELAYSGARAPSSFEPSHNYAPSGQFPSIWTYAEQETVSPYASEYKHGFGSPYYSATGTPPTGPESVRSVGGSGISSRTSHHDITLVDRKLRNLDLYQQYQPPPPDGYLLVSGTGYDYSMHASSTRMNPLATPYNVANGSGFQYGYAANLRMPPREQDQVQVIRSPLLEEFRMSNKTNKRYELRDIFNHVVEFSGDQHGSRFIQQKLETANSDEKDQIFKEIQPNSLQLMTDVFGNYVIQKLFEHGNQSHKKVLANHMKGHIWTLSMQMYGCRVVQKALEHVLTDQQASMVKELDGPAKQILKVIRDQNGNHVVQKAIERVPAEHIQFIIEAHKGEVVKLATHTYGCRVIQRILEHCEPAAKRVILDELHGCVGPLITDSFGNYVVQHVIQNGEAEDRRRVVGIVQQQLLIFSKHKFASNVVEMCIEYADNDQRAEIVRKLIGQNEHGQTPVLGLLRDQYGNYVIQRIHAVSKGAELEALTNEMKYCFPQLKRSSYGKQVMAIEKLLYGGTAPHSAVSASSLDSSPSSSHANEGSNDLTYGNQMMRPHQVQPRIPNGTSNH